MTRPDEWVRERTVVAGLPGSLASCSSRERDICAF